MEASKVIHAPIATATLLDMDEPSSPVNQTMYRGIIGSLLYLTASRLDIVFSVVLCARISSGQKKHVWNGTFPGFLTNIMRYKEAKLCGTLNFVVDQAADRRLWKFSDFVPILCDNTSALNMAKNPVQHKRTKHTVVRHHFLRYNVEKGLICMKFYNTEDQIADIFTKALNREHFEKNRLALGLIKTN
uniref:Uncharacterized protein LOC104227104 n=1 Tax=Nicotiana sylvestris TaxID=4096 RepID=A0A1U7WFV9_NICSY|nr:PREDICTED: uncharacterized protein LOC104227104 [Nicotiana sylvestris]